MRSPRRPRSRESTRVTVAVVLLFAVLGAGRWWWQGRQPATQPTTQSTSQPTSRPGAPPTTRPTTLPSTRPRTGLPRTASEALALVEVGLPDSSSGYSRLLFGPDWLDPDGNGCDARNDVLRRDLTDVVLRPRTNGCIVERGVLLDPYTGVRQAFTRGPQGSQEVQIDHVVSLSNAWRTGAQAWTPARRAAFANDPLELLAVRKASNTDKDYRDAAGWLPPRPELRCAFVARVVAVKAAYRLRMTQAEHDAIAAVLGTCPQQVLPG